MPDLLLELLSEEIPARMQARAAEDLMRLACVGLKKAGLKFESAEAFVTPRRLTLVVEGLPEKLAAKSEERRGPRTDAPEKAVEGFKGSLPEGAKIEKRETEKGEFYFALVEQKGQATIDVIAEKIPEFIRGLSWPKSMRWADAKFNYVRPLQNVLCLFNEKIVHGEIHLGTDTFLKFSDCTLGHRFLSPKPFKVGNFADYKAKLEKAHVVLDPGKRRTTIEAEAEKLAKKEGLEFKDDPGLLDEVTGLVEWPVVLMGGIDKAFMELPPEVLTTVMRHHQKYFALLDKKGELAPRFIVVANTETTDKGKAIIAGNERVLRARLADAKFFWDQDLKRTLESRVDGLKDRVFHAKLGSVLDKVGRIVALAGNLAEPCGADAEDAKRAARLAKADLSTEMVGEFPELQGVMGRYYALQDGEKPEVAAAVAEHYSPLGPGDSCPSAPVSVTVALVDKIDSLVGFWAVEEKPTGSKDPYALRRASLSVIRLILENELTLAIREVIEAAWNNFPDGNDRDRLHAFQEDLRFFIFDRLKVYLRDKGIPPDLIDALFASGGEDDLLRIVRKADVLKTFLNTDNGANLLIAYKRANNIVEIESKKDNQTYFEFPNEDQFQQDEEHVLLTMLNNIARFGGTNHEMVEFEIIVQRLAALREPVDALFDHVTVNCSDKALRENRLRLLNQILATMNSIADFSQIEGGER